MSTSDAVVAATRALAADAAVAEAVDAARAACTALRWHQALRRRIPQAAAESRVRGARASALLDGADLPLDAVRDLMRGAVTWSGRLDPVETSVKGAVAVTAATEDLAGVLRTAPLQTLARLHTAAAADLVPAEALGRPRSVGEECREFVTLGPAAPAEALAERLAGVGALLEALPQLPVAVVAALAHAEIVQARPFLAGNGLVARALERLVIHAGGLDPTGVAVPEAGHARAGGAAYVGALTAYGQGDLAGVRLWLVSAAEAIAAGAREGEAVADAVLAGRLRNP